VELRPTGAPKGATHSFTPSQPTRFTRVAAGDYTLIARRRDGKSWVDVASEPVKVEAGKTLAVRLPR
jgi:hypothetical protein